jgi:Tfp pilus assembly protein PilN
MHKLNLIPADILKEKSKRNFKLAFFILSFFSILLIVYSVFQINNKINQTAGEIRRVRNELGAYRLKISENQKTESMIKNLEQRRKIYFELNEKKFEWSLLIKEIFSKKPSEVTIVSLKVDDSRKLSIKGLASKNIYVAHMMEELKQIERISIINLNYSRYEENGDASFSYSFEISGSIAKD